jgi:hypothetical protein
VNDDPIKKLKISIPNPIEPSLTYAYNIELGISAHDSTSPNMKDKENEKKVVGLCKLYVALQL